ncbi:MAG TPA: DUF4861 domain-containing protein [Vicinamibacteria bacterium]|nr:DUF4861 domain-containing protein [Vicinamibacteria bacterium]
MMLAAGIVLAAGVVSAHEAAPSAAFTITVRNELDLARTGETVELTAAVLGATRAEDYLKVAVAEAGKDLLTQAVDSDGDGVFDQVVFQSAFAPRQAKAFTVRLLPQRRMPKKEDFRVYGRFNRERFDDFAWENDRVAHRMYGPALETWQKEPLTSSTVDVWVKRTRRLVINDWYMVDDYHRDHGEGADFYSAGPSRGCGGSGIWAGDTLHVSRNFRESRVLANGPVRLVFELSYLPWEAGPGRRVTEKKRITLDAGSNLNRIESSYTFEGPGDAQWAAGIKKPAGSDLRVEKAQGWIRTWEEVRDGNGHLGCGILVDPSLLADVREVAPNTLVIARLPDKAPVRYYAGSAWDRSGDFAGVADWDRYLEAAARRLASPLKVSVAR